MEFGVGIHGEPGRRAKDSAGVGGRRRDDRGDPRRPRSAGGSELLAFVNGLGGTPLIELYLLYDELAKQLEARGLKRRALLVGNYITSLEMAGASITLVTLDDELTALWDAPVHTPALRWGRWRAG